MQRSTGTDPLNTKHNDMSRKKLSIFAILAPMFLAACSTDDGSAGGQDAQLSSMPVCFSSGTTQGKVTSRATADYMALGGRFVCRMYYQGSATGTDYNAYTEAWLQVNNNYGNSVFRKNTFVDPEYTDTHGFDKGSTIFYWQNRKPHIFIALADYNKLTTNTGTADGTLQMSTPTMVYDLRRKAGMNSVADQLDIIQAHTVMTPMGATPEKNTVQLYFNHCFSKVQVNLKAKPGGGLDDFTAENIDKVELLGIADTAYVYHIDVTQDDTHTAYDTTFIAPTAKEVLTTNYTKQQVEANPYCTSIEMFKAAEATLDYATTHDVITFGNIRAIRITWHEKDYPDQKHVMTKQITGDDRILKSGCRHIFNMQLGRGILTIINAEILPWETHTTYKIDGTIHKDS